MIYKFLIVNIESGVLIYSKDFINTDERDMEILFSGAMSAINNIMSEVKMGNIKTIKTEKYQIIGEASREFGLFIIGNFVKRDEVSSFLSFISEYLIGLPNNYFQNNRLSEDVIQELEQLVTHFADSLARLQAYKISIFIHEGRFGFSKITTGIDNQLESQLIGYFSALSSDHREGPHVFLEVIPDNGKLLGLNWIHKKTGKVIIFGLHYSKFTIESIIGHRHIFINKAIEFLNDNFEVIKQKQNDYEIQKLIDQFIVDIDASFDNFQANLNFLGTDLILSAISDLIPTAITSLLLGKPLVVVSTNEDARPIIDLLSYLTGITNVSMEFSSEYPSRITWSPPNLVDIFIELNYTILDLYSLKIKNGLDSKFMTRTCNEIYRDNEKFNDIIQQLRVTCKSLWKFVEIILSRYMNEDNPDTVLNEIKENDMQKLVSRMVTWINPHVFNTFQQNVDYQKVNW